MPNLGGDGSNRAVKAGACVSWFWSICCGERVSSNQTSLYIWMSRLRRGLAVGVLSWFM